MNVLKEKLQYLIETKMWIPLMVALFFVVLLFFLIFRMVSGNTQQNQQGNSQKASQPTSTIIPTQSPFRIISTEPKDNEINIVPGEIAITFTTDRPILSSKSFHLTISPKAPLTWESTNYPTTTVSAQVVGGLLKNTTYTVSVTDSNGLLIGSWSFTTSDQQPDSSSQLERIRETQDIQKDAPLFAFVPYDTPDFHIDYSGILTLEVDVKSNDLDKIKQEVNDWIRSHGVDPSTHTIYYVTDFVTPVP